MACASRRSSSCSTICPAPAQKGAMIQKHGKRCTMQPPSPDWALAIRWRPWPTPWDIRRAPCFPIPHGRAVGFFLPYTIEFTARGYLPTRYAEIARFLGLPAGDEAEGAASLSAAIRTLARTHSTSQPRCRRRASPERILRPGLPKLVDNALNDSALLVGLRVPRGRRGGKSFSLRLRRTIY